MMKNERNTLILYGFVSIVLITVTVVSWLKLDHREQQRIKEHKEQLLLNAKHEAEIELLKKQDELLRQQDTALEHEIVDARKAAEQQYENNKNIINSLDDNPELEHHVQRLLAELKLPTKK